MSTPWGVWVTSGWNCTPTKLQLGSVDRTAAYGQVSVDAIGVMLALLSSEI